MKLGDFGVSRVLSATAELAKTFVGTPYYLAPEIWKERKYSKESDIWALGVILYEMICFKKPLPWSVKPRKE